MQRRARKKSLKGISAHQGKTVGKEMHMADTIFVVGHKNPDTDSICAAIAYAELKSKTGSRQAKPMRAGEISKETKFILRYFETDAPELLGNAAGKKLILMDHNEVGQAVDGLEDAELLEIIDHHRLGGMKTAYPIRFNAQPVGSTSIIVAKEFSLNGVEMNAKTAGLLLSGIVSDTVMFKSPTTTDEDREIAEKLIKKSGLDLQGFGSEIMRAKCDIQGRSIAQIVGGDLKEYDFSGEKVGIGAIEIADFKDIEPMREQVLREMERIRAEKQWTMMILMITDIVRGDSKLLTVGQKLDVLERAFQKKVHDRAIYLEGVMSRKQQVVPPLEKTFRDLSKKQ